MKKIPPFKLNAEPLSEVAKNLPKFKYAPDEIGTRHLLGGDPDFIQNADYPDCTSCGEKMTFYAQLDSLNDEYVVADCGMIYVFVCFRCNKTESFIQSY